MVLPTTPFVRALVRWDTGKIRLTERLPKLRLVTQARLRQNTTILTAVYLCVVLIGKNIQWLEFDTAVISQYNRGFPSTGTRRLTHSHRRPSPVTTSRESSAIMPLCPSAPIAPVDGTYLTPSSIKGGSRRRFLRTRTLC